MAFDVFKYLLFIYLYITIYSIFYLFYKYFEYLFIHL